MTVFLRINDELLNVECIESIKTLPINKKYKNHYDICRIIIIFKSYVDKKPLHAHTYWESISKIIWDWSHNKYTLFEIPLLDSSDLGE